MRCSIRPLNDVTCTRQFSPFPNKPWFLRVWGTGLLKTLGKGEIARNEHFLLYSQCFYPFGELTTIFMKSEIYVCKPRVWKSPKFVVWVKCGSVIRIRP